MTRSTIQDELRKLPRGEAHPAPAEERRKITPYLPEFARKAAIEHEQIFKMPVMVFAFEEMPNACRNCGGIGGVYLMMCKGGPYHAPTFGAVSTWFDGDGTFGRGWYTVDETKSFVCPECNNGGKKR